MAVPAQKIDDYIDKINECKVAGKPLGDLDRFAIESNIRNTMDSQPALALTLRAVLAHLDGLLDNAKQDMEAAAAIAPTSVTVRSNLALMLAEVGHNEQATAELRYALRLCAEQGNWQHIEQLAVLAISLGDMESMATIIHIANKLGKCAPTLTYCAVILQMGEASDASELCINDREMPEDTLRLCSTKISDERWAALEKLAQELEPLVN